MAPCSPEIHYIFPYIFVQLSSVMCPESHNSEKGAKSARNELQSHYFVHFLATQLWFFGLSGKERDTTGIFKNPCLIKVGKEL